MDGGGGCSSSKYTIGFKYLFVDFFRELPQSIKLQTPQNALENVYELISIQN